MAVDGVDSNQYWYSIENEEKNQSESTSNTGTVDKDAFLKLLVAQLENQDPLNPMDDKETIAQMAQFSTLEQIQNMNKNLQNSQEEIKEALFILNENYLITNDNMMYQLDSIKEAIESYEDIINDNLENQEQISNELNFIRETVEEYVNKDEVQLEEYNE